jgi:HSP20 family protein
MRDDRDDPFDDFFREIERMMNGVMGAGLDGGDPTGFATDTHVDVQESDEEIRVVADLPGIERGDLTLKCDGDTFTISASNATREFDERVRLPASVDKDAGSAAFNNGVLEVTFPKAGDSTSISLE